MKGIVLGCLFLLFSTQSIGQNLLSLIPSQSKQILIIRGGSLEENCQLSKLSNQEDYKRFEERFQESIADTWYGIFTSAVYTGKARGIGTDREYYRFDVENDSIESSAYVFEVTGKGAFDTYLKELLDEEDWNSKNSNGQYEFIVKPPHAIAWNQKTLLLFEGYVNRGYLRNHFSSDDYYVEELSEREQSERDIMMDEIKEKLILQTVHKLYNHDFEESILSDKRFMQVFSDSFDVCSYKRNVLEPSKKRGYGRYDPYDYEYGYGEEPYRPKEEEEPNRLLENNSLYNYWQFEDRTKLKARTYVDLNPELQSMLRKASAAKFNKNFFQYMENGEFTGYISLSLNTRASFEMLSSVYPDFGKFIPGLGRTFSSTFKLLGGLIDKKKALSIFEGNLLFAVTDMHEVDVKYESYHYNEDHIRERIIKTKKEMRPEYVLLVATGNEEVAMKLFDMLEEQGRLVNQGSYYRIRGRSNRLDPKSGSVSSYLAYHKGIILMTNNEDLMMHKLSTGYPKDQRLDKTWQNRIAAHPYSTYWDLEKLANSMESEINMPRKFSGLLHAGGTMFDKFEMNGMYHEKDRSYLKGRYVLKQDSDNSDALFDLIDMLTGLETGKGYDEF